MVPSILILNFYLIQNLFKTKTQPNFLTRNLLNKKFLIQKKQCPPSSFVKKIPDRSRTEKSKTRVAICGTRESGTVPLTRKGIRDTGTENFPEHGPSPVPTPAGTYSFIYNGRKKANLWPISIFIPTLAL